MTCSRSLLRSWNAGTRCLLCKPGLDFRALIAEAQFKSGQRPLPPPPELRLHRKDDKDTRNMELQAKTSKRIEVPVSNPQNKDPLDLDWDTNRDATLEHMRERTSEGITLE